MTYVDLLVLIYLSYFLVLGFYRGFFRQLLDLLALFLSFFLAYKFYQPIGSFLGSQFRIPTSFASVFGFFLVWFVIEVIYYIIFIAFYDRLPARLRESKVNRAFGLLPALIRGLISVWIILSLVLILPLPISDKAVITNSLSGKAVGRSSGVVEKYLGDIFGKFIDETIDFLTIKPDSEEKVELGFTETNLTVDKAAENEMLALVNKERTSRGLKPLVMDEELQKVARAHARDMFEKGYFAHNNLEGQTPFDRMDEAGIKYMYAGENLALAPTVETAHTGLMNSEGHKRNILDGDFQKIGIGVMASEKHGLMFAQEFTD